MGKLGDMVMIRSWIRGRCQMYQPRRDISPMKGTLTKINRLWMLTLNEKTPMKSNPQRVNKGKGQESPREFPMESDLMVGFDLEALCSSSEAT